MLGRAWHRRPPRPARLLLVLSAVLVLAAGACADPDPPAEVTIRATEFDLSVAPARADEGSVRIFLDNEGELEHGLVMVRAPRREDLPLAPDGSVDLSKAQVADRLEPVAPGRYRIQPDLFPGPLVILCNLVTPGPDGTPISHYQAGMWAEFRVDATSSASTLPAP